MGVVMMVRTNVVVNVLTSRVVRIGVVVMVGLSVVMVI